MEIQKCVTSEKLPNQTGLKAGPESFVTKKGGCPALYSCKFCYCVLMYEKTALLTLKALMTIFINIFPCFSEKI